MGKKKGKSSNNSNNNAGSKPPSPREIENAAADTTVLLPDPLETAVADEPSPTSHSPEKPDTPESPDSNEQLLAAARQEIEELKQKLADAQAEIASLKQAAESSACPATGAGSETPAAPPPEEMQKLQERLSQLKKEQADADAAKDVAWKQLKSVVAEIRKLAVAPDQAGKSATTPTAA